MNCCSILVTLFVGVAKVYFIQSATVPIGLVIEPSRTTEISAVTFAVEFANTNILSTDTLTLSTAVIDVSNSPQSVIQQTCALVTTGHVAQIGPASSTNAGMAGPILERLGIPHIAPVATSPLLTDLNNTIHMVPPDMMQGAAIASIIQKMAWRNVHILSSDDEYGTFGLLSFVEIASNSGWDVVSMQYFQSNIPAPNITVQLNTIKDSGYRVIVLNCIYQQAQYILIEAQMKGMTGAGWIWIVTDGVTNSAVFLPAPPLPDYLKGILGTGFSANSGGLSAQFQAQWATLDVVVYPGAGTSTITTAVARWADAVFAIAYAVRDFGGPIGSPVSLSCNSGSTWENGTTLLQAIKNVKQPGIAQDIDFTNNYPAVAKYNILNTDSSGWNTVATWNLGGGYQAITGKSITLPGGLPGSPDFISSINGKHFKIVTAKSTAFFYYPVGITLPADKNNVKAGIEMIGYGIDFMNELARILNFTYTLYLSPDGKWGGVNKTSGEWNGMVGELVKKNADFAFATLTISRIRESAIDFSTPYIDVGLKVTLPKDTVVSADFGFMKVFEDNVWYAVGITLLLVGIMTSTLEKLSPDGYHGEFVQTNHQMSKVNQSLKNRKIFRRHKKDALSVMRLDNSIWYTWATIIQQGYDRYPQALSTRVISILWFFGVLAILSMYTAKLGAVLISLRLQGSINSVQELYNQDRITYGVGKDTSVESFFCDNEIPLYKNMCLKMRKWDSWVYGGSAQARAWLAKPNGQWAFITDSPIIDAIVERQPCNVRKIEEIFNTGGFGVGMQKGSPYNEIVSQTILQLRENRFMDELFTKWFTHTSECAALNKVLSDTEKNQMKYSDLKGIFYIVVISAMMSPLLVLVEFIHYCIGYKRKTAKDGMPMSFCAVISYRLGKMSRDFKIYTIPEFVKNDLGLHEYTRQRQNEIWLINAKEHSLARKKLAMMQQTQHFAAN